MWEKRKWRTVLTLRREKGCVGGGGDTLLVSQVSPDLECANKISPDVPRPGLFLPDLLPRPLLPKHEFL